MLLGQFCNNSFTGAGINFQARYLTMRLLNVGHVTCWSNWVAVTTLWRLHFIERGQTQGYKKSQGSLSNLSCEPIFVL